MDKDKFKDFISSAFGDRHIDGSNTTKKDIENVPGTDISYCDIPLHTIDIRKFIHTNIQIINQYTGIANFKKHQLIRELFKNWYIMGWDRALGWIGTYYGGIENATKRIKEWEDKHYPNDDNKRTDCNDPEKVAFRTAIITGVEILNTCKEYKEFNNDDNITVELFNQIVKHTKN